MRLGLLLVLGGLLEGDAFVRGGSQLPRLRRQLHIGGSGARARPTMKMVEDIVSLPRRYERWPLGDAQANPTNVQRPFSGLRGDIALRLPTYVDDWRAGLQAKTVGATLFLYFACLAPVVAFGGALQLATQGSLGIIECIISRGVCGMVRRRRQASVRRCRRRRWGWAWCWLRGWRLLLRRQACLQRPE